MYLKKIKISNFRGFDEKGIEAIFDKGVNAIIGENNNGKSAIIDAIRIAFSVLEYRKDIFFTKSDFHINLQGKRAEESQIDIYFDDVPKYLIEIIDPETCSTGEFHLKFYISKSKSGVEKVNYIIWGGNIEGNEITKDTLEAVDIAFLGALRDAETEMKPSRTSRLANLLNEIVVDEEDRNELVEVLKEANVVLAEKEQISNVKQIINRNLMSMEQEVLSQQIDIGLIEPKFDSITSSLRTWVKSKWVFIQNDKDIYKKIQAILNQEKIEDCVKVENEGMYVNVNAFKNVVESCSNIDDETKDEIKTIEQRDFQLNQNGLGYNNLICMSTILGDMSIEKVGVVQNLLLVEEPEAHLHPQLQELVHEFFENKLVEDSNIQVIYTSHSPTLVSKIDLKKINVLVENDYRIDCISLTDKDLNLPDENYLKKYLDVTKSQMFFAKGIIFVEGISEALLIPEFAKLMGKPLDKYAIEVVNVNGLAFAPFVNVLSEFKSENKAFIKTVIITDDDRASKKEDTDTYISKDLDYNDDLLETLKKLEKGKPSDRYTKLEKLCKSKGIEVFSAVKTFEYELAFCEKNIEILLEIIQEIHSTVGKKLKAKIDTLKDIKEKRICIWLFIRARDRDKGEIAQKLSSKIAALRTKEIRDDEINGDFIIPSYIENAIDYITKM